ASGSTQGERNERIPAPKAIATCTRVSLGCLPRVHDEVEAVKATRTLEGHGALGSHVPRARVRRKDERHDPSQAHLVEAVVDERASGLRRVTVPTPAARARTRPRPPGLFPRPERARPVRETRPTLSAREPTGRSPEADAP